MPVHLRELALSISQCSEVGRVDEFLPNAQVHPCHKVVHAQDNHGGPFQVPEAWAGNLETAKVVFVSSNPAISEGRPEAKLPSKRIAEMYPTSLWEEDDTADFMTRRFTSDRQWVLDRRHLKVDGASRGSKEPYWGWVQKQTEALLGHDSAWHEQAVMTEVVHCKSNNEEGVAEAAPHCSSLHMGRILNATDAELIVVVGDKAKKAFAAAYPVDFRSYPRFGTSETDGRADPTQNILTLEIGGRQRTVCFIWHPGAGSFSKKITHLPDLYPDDFDKLQAAALGNTLARKPVPPASRIRRQKVIEEILDPLCSQDKRQLRTELLKALSPAEARTWLNSHNSGLNGSPADVFLLYGADPVMTELTTSTQHRDEGGTDMQGNHRRSGA